jgi:hypothetical protein
MLSSLLLLFFFSYQYVEYAVASLSCYHQDSPLACRQVLIAQNASIDWITMGVSIWNFGTVGLLCIHWRGPLLLQQFYLVAVSALMALVLIKNVSLGYMRSSLLYPLQYWCPSLSYRTGPLGWCWLRSPSTIYLQCSPLAVLLRPWSRRLRFAVQGGC